MDIGNDGAHISLKRLPHMLYSKRLVGLLFLQIGSCKYVVQFDNDFAQLAPVMFDIFCQSGSAAQLWSARLLDTFSIGRRWFISIPLR